MADDFDYALAAVKQAERERKASVEAVQRCAELQAALEVANATIAEERQRANNAERRAALNASGVELREAMTDVVRLRETCANTAERAERERQRAERAEAAAAQMRAMLQCEECGEPATAYYRTEGDGPYWLCDAKDDGHVEGYDGEEVLRLSDAGKGWLSPAAAEALRAHRDEAVKQRDAWDLEHQAMQLVVLETRAEAEALQRRAAAMRGALERIVAISADRERFVMMGPRGFAAAEQVARAALASDAGTGFVRLGDVLAAVNSIAPVGVSEGDEVFHALAQAFGQLRDKLRALASGGGR